MCFLPLMILLYWEIFTLFMLEFILNDRIMKRKKKKGLVIGVIGIFTFIALIFLSYLVYR